MQQDNSEKQSYFGFVALIGKPNVGKSTLMNHLIGQKVSITSRKPQTTRNRILGVETDGAYQIVYVDTPGLHTKEAHELNKLMNKAASDSMGDVELILMLVDPLHWGTDDELVLKKIKKAKAPVVLVLNKVDEVKNKEDLLPIIDKLRTLIDFEDVVPISALKGQNLDSLRQVVRKYVKEGPHYFPDDSITDKSQRFLVAEIIREKIMRQLGDEIPYSTTVEIENFAEGETVRIDAAILVDKEGQKKILIGKDGARIKKIGTEARLDIERMLDTKVFLKLFVKIKSGWSDDLRVLNSLGFDK
ncbi:MAG: GTPase Era [Succinivibrio sp.]|nr:GTPase Era [Succinivibrio sp.]